ncbi:MAG TPA: LAGLIDADG family homing endonuclease [Anaerolineales bacterium]|nr:LAGLIDADG family homing endonuclease [Anaerolineales bacterium]
MEANNDLNYFIAGFVAGEGSFFVTTSTTTTWPQVTCAFSIKIRADDREMLEIIRRALKFSGAIHYLPSRRYQYSWNSIKRHDAVMLIIRDHDELMSYVIPFFDRYLLHSQKRRNYEIWKQVVQMMDRGEHLTGEGLQKILELKSQMNRYQGQDVEDESLSDSADEHE